MKGIKIVILSVIFVCLSACHLLAGQDDQPNQNMERNLEFFDKKLQFVEGIQVDKYKSEKIELIGLDKRSKFVYQLVQTEGHYRIIAYENEMLVSSSEELSFASPEFIRGEGGKIYILDSKLNQIILMGTDFKEITKFNLKKEDSSANYLDFEVLNGEMYYTLQTSMTSSAHIFKITSDGNVSEITSRFMGYLAIFENKLYAVSTQEYFEDNKFTGFQSGQNSLFVLNQSNNLEKLYDFWSGYAPTDFVIEDGQLFVFGGSGNSIDQFEFSNGQYVHSLAQIEEESNLRVNMIKIDSKFYIFLPGKKNVWLVSEG